MHTRKWWLGVVLLLFAACKEQAPHARPETAVEELIHQMRRVHGEPGAAESAYDLLWSEAQANLQERAKRASALTGRKIEPAEMITPSKFMPSFTPRSFEAEHHGKWARVLIAGEQSGERAEARCVVEDGRWRVAVRLPPLPIIEKRSAEER